MLCFKRACQLLFNIYLDEIFYNYNKIIRAIVLLTNIIMYMNESFVTNE
jgi:hypothetical protein